MCVCVGGGGTVLVVYSIIYSEGISSPPGRDPARPPGVNNRTYG